MVLRFEVSAPLPVKLFSWIELLEVPDFWLRAFLSSLPLPVAEDVEDVVRLVALETAAGAPTAVWEEEEEVDDEEEEACWFPLRASFCVEPPDLKTT